MTQKRRPGRPRVEGKPPERSYSVRLSAALYERLHRHAAQCAVSAADLVRSILDDGIPRDEEK